MAARAPHLPRTGAPPSNNLRQPIPPGSTPMRASERSVDGAGSSVVANAVPGPEGHGDQHTRQLQNTNRFEQGFSSGQGRHTDEWRQESFNGQGFGSYDEGYFEGNNAFGNGYGSQNRGNYRQRPYRQFYSGNRARNYNYRGSSGRFNANNNRYQRVFTPHENNMVNEVAQEKDKGSNQVAISSIGASDANLGVQNIETSSVDSMSARAQKKIDKMLCLRCGEAGHLAETCTVALCLYCEKTSHESKNCPLLSMPKPVAVTYGVSRNELMFHEVPASSDVTFRHDSGKVGKISVTDGSLTPQEVVAELEWIIPGNYQWNLTPIDDGSFKAIFPTKADLARMTKIINVPVPGTSMYLHFEEWSAAELDKFYLTPVWVRVQGCCYKERCDYLSLFGVGSLIGKTKEVDMEFTRSHTTVRMLVEVTRAEHIPKTTVDHTYDGQGYGLIFRLEEVKGKGKKEDAEMHDVDPDDGSKEEDGKNKEAPKKDDPPPKEGPATLSSSAAVMPTKQSTGMSNQTHVLSLPSMKVGQIDCQLSPKIEVRFWSQNKTNTLVPRKLWGDSDDDEEESLPSPLPRLMNDEDVALVADQVGSLPLKEVPPENLASFSVVPGKDEAAFQYGVAADNLANPFSVVGMSEAVQNCVAADDSVVFSAEAGLSAVSTAGDVAPKNCSPNVCKSTSKNKVSSSSVLPNLSQGLHGKVGTGVFLGGRCSMEDVVKFGGISPPSKDLRSSERIRVQHNADDSQMARAQQLAQAKNVALFSETIPLDETERNSLREAKLKINKLHRDEEAKWAQRAKVRHIQEGGDNTKYFHLIANGKHRRKRIFQLEQDEGTILGYPSGYALDPYVVLSPAFHGPPGHGFWVQPFGDGSTGFLQPVRLAF
ncbi:hypothetical protein QYE76_035899 [Lolium multiflorum]|uniref:CCHC-type domain-containing protein n=1 Tax=Lolium multiflorum TaxID=4521 RepID=A0AAD8R0P8_LOLMU|nr:hypothetical protein QYE76_035899 [Lolium multiflorum]